MVVFFCCFLTGAFVDSCGVVPKVLFDFRGGHCFDFNVWVENFEKVFYINLCYVFIYAFGIIWWSV